LYEAAALSECFTIMIQELWEYTLEKYGKARDASRVGVRQCLVADVLTSAGPAASGLAW